MMRASRYLGDECVSVINEKGKLKSYYEESTYRYFTLKRRNVLLSWLSARQLARILDAEEIDILHLHWTKDLPVAIMAKLLSQRKPKVVQSRHMRMTRFKDDFYHRFLYRNLDMILAVTHQVKGQIEKFIPSAICSKVETLYIGAEQPVLISEEDKKNRREELGLGHSFTVGIIGRIEEQKGQHIVLKAVENLVKKGIDAKALVIGAAMDELYLQKLQNEYRDIAIFTGFTREAQSIMQLCDVMVLATKNETFGLVLIEAMMCGVCVISSDSGGPLEIIDDGINGLFFKTFDSDDLEDKLELLHRAPLFRQKFAEMGRVKALDKFESQTQFETLNTILEKV
jgi:glycosyltransferase involved in cell wall biosynthesis